MQILADLNDIGAWLTEDKLEVDEPTTSPFQVEAQRIVRAQLTGVFQPTTIVSWNEPANTPGLIRGIAGRLIAAYLYREAYSEDDTSIPEYAQKLYDEAVGMLLDIRTGALVVTDDTGEPIEENTLNMNATDFYPNDDAPGPYFSMSQEFA